MRKVIPKTSIFHGSPKFFKKIKPQKHRLAENKNVVFGTPLLSVALLSTARWTDNDFSQGMINNHFYMMEKKRGLFDKKYKDKNGWIYVLDPKSFYHQENLTKFEYISNTSPKILDYFKVYNVLDALLDLQDKGLIEMVFFDDRFSFFEKYGFNEGDL